MPICSPNFLNGTVLEHHLVIIVFPINVHLITTTSNVAKRPAFQLGLRLFPTCVSGYLACHSNADVVNPTIN